MTHKKSLAVAALLILSSTVFVMPQASANHDPFDTDLHPCSIAPDPPAMTGTTTATATATYTCPTPHRRMTVQVWIEVFRPLAGGYSTVASDTSSSGSTVIPFWTNEVTGTVCLSGATQMKTRATGYWYDSHGNQRGTRHDESLPVPLSCPIR